MFSFRKRSSSCTKRKESVSMQNFPTVCKTLFLALFTWFQVYAVRLHTPQSLTIMEIPPLWILKSSSPFITATKAVPWTLWLRIYTVYIQGDTPTSSGIFFCFTPHFRLASLSGQTGKLHQLLLGFFLCADTLYTVPSRAATGPLSLCVQCECWMYCCSGCVSAHLHIPQALSHSFRRAREGPGCQPARLHS